MLALMLVPHIGAFPFSRVEGLWRRSIVQVRGGRRLYGSQRPILTGQDQIIDLSPVTLSEVIPGGSGERVSAPTKVPQVNASWPRASRVHDDAGVH